MSGGGASAGGAGGGVAARSSGAALELGVMAGSFVGPHAWSILHALPLPGIICNLTVQLDNYITNLTQMTLGTLIFFVVSMAIK